jgi:hypothetical protein
VGGLHVLTDPAVGVAAAQTPAPLPSPSDLAALDPSVAITLLVASVVLALLVYIGPAVRDRIRPPKPSEPSSPAAPVGGPAALAALPAGSAAAAVDRTEQFLQHLLRQIEAGNEREEELEALLRTRDERIGQLERENLRLESMLWQRGQR